MMSSRIGGVDGSCGLIGGSGRRWRCRRKRCTSPEYVHGNRPVPSNEVVETLADALDVDPEFFREYRVRVITEKLEAMPDLVDRLYKRLNG